MHAADCCLRRCQLCMLFPCLVGITQDNLRMSPVFRLQAFVPIIITIIPSVLLSSHTLPLPSSSSYPFSSPIGEMETNWSNTFFIPNNYDSRWALAFVHPHGPVEWWFYTIWLYNWELLERRHLLNESVGFCYPENTLCATDLRWSRILARQGHKYVVFFRPWTHLSRLR